MFRMAYRNVYWTNRHAFSRFNQKEARMGN